MLKKKVLFFGDFGVDDIVATIYSYYTEEIEIVGFVADYGNISKEDALRNIYFLQNKFGITNIPVISGAVSALTGDLPNYFPEIHGVAGLGSIIPEDSESNNGPVSENFYKVVEIVNQYKGELTIYCAGRLTSLATVFVLYPETMKHLKDIYIMGGAFTVPGNVTPLAEANFHGDPYAANIVLQMAPMKVYIIPLDVTMYAIFTPAMINRLNDYYQNQEDKVGLLIKPMVDYYYDFYKKNYPAISGSPLHDLLAIWSITEQSEISFKQVPIKVSVNKGVTIGQSAGDFRDSPDKESWPVHNVALQFNYNVFIKQVFNAFLSSPKERQ
ncbi:purine nucleosidase [Bacillus pakistanensis]|uniref:Purine nucleosidase n=1 Tax=Rossellomorea pakistanensis TaxID=992288 RepID=A0ABS2N8S1_9BACI|nr:nucleoside hydrolase [Bacillus pakistanensis]MBM7584249.1 purine nucleosidase [Bacillus pakistanensis]